MRRNSIPLVGCCDGRWVGIRDPAAKLCLFRGYGGFSYAASHVPRSLSFLLWLGACHLILLFLGRHFPVVPVLPENCEIPLFLEPILVSTSYAVF